MPTLTLVEAVRRPRDPNREHALDVQAWAKIHKPGDSAMISCLFGITRQARKRCRTGCVTAAEVIAMFYKADGRCALSGVKFSLEKVGTSSRRPFAPSLDRIDSTGGYRRGNVRLICCAVNLMLNEWGDPVFERVAASLRGSA